MNDGSPGRPGQFMPNAHDGDVQRNDQGRNGRTVKSDGIENGRAEPWSPPRRDEVSRPGQETSPRPGHGHTSKRRSGGFLLGDIKDRRKRSSKLGNGESFMPQHDGHSPSSISGLSAKSQGKQPATWVSQRGPARDERIVSNGTQIMDGQADQRVSEELGSLSSRGSSDRSTNIDPNLLIQMAIGLSNSRRRATSGIYVPEKTIPARRAVSHGHKHAQKSHGATQMSVTRELSDRSFPPLDFLDTTAQPGGPFVASIATQQRVDRAKLYYKLSMEYRRLANLAPLRRSAITKAGTSQECSTLVHNPLQYLRNQRCRARDQEVLSPASDVFLDPSTTAEYVNHVELLQERSPLDVRELELPPAPEAPNDENTTLGHRRDATTSSKIIYFDSPWSYTPENLIADLIWSSSAEHKWSLLDHEGQRLFPDLQPPLLDITPSQSRTHTKRLRAETIERDSRPTGGERGRHKRKFLSIHRLDDDGQKRVLWARRRSQSSSRASSRSSASAVDTYGDGAADGFDIGPLVRHLQKQMERQQKETLETTSPSKRWSQLPPDTKSKGTTANSATIKGIRRGVFKALPNDIHKARSFTEGTPDADQRKIDTNLDALMPAIRSAKECRSAQFTAEQVASPVSMTFDNGSGRRDRPFPLTRAQTAGRDFALGTETVHVTHDANDETIDGESVRRSFDSNMSSFELDGGTANDQTVSPEKISHDDTVPDKPKVHRRGMSRIFKGGRFIDLVRSDTGKTRQPTPSASAQQSAENLNRRQADQPEKFPEYDEAPMTHVALPSFTFPGGVGRPQLSRQLTNETIEIGLVPKDGRARAAADDSRATKSRSSSPRPPSSPSLRALLAPIKRLRSSSNNKVPTLKTLTVSPTSPIRKSNLGLVQPLTHGDEGMKGFRKRQWSIADQLDRHTTKDDDDLSQRDVERVKALFLASGIKAQELCRRAEEVPSSHPSLLVTAARGCNHDIGAIPSKNAYSEAARLRKMAIRRMQELADQHLHQFHHQETPAMHARIDKLQHAAAEELPLAMQTLGDDADAFTADLTMHQTMAVKAVLDGLEDLSRRQRRKFRWLRKAGFVTLEWSLVTFMWLAWFTFVLFKIVRGVVFGAVKVTGWLLCFD